MIVFSLRNCSIISEVTIVNNQGHKMKIELFLKNQIGLFVIRLFLNRIILH
ncbi:MAG TPA: hypothetical protein DEF41_07670 [Desulfovibrio sp.]|nr:hypothetical protein [Desulfovibrio sp.]